MEDLIRLWTLYKASIKPFPGELLMDDTGKILNVSPDFVGFMNFLEEKRGDRE